MREPHVQVHECLAAILAQHLQRAAIAHSLHILPEPALSPLVVHGAEIYRLGVVVSRH